MVCLPVVGANPQALRSGLSPLQVGKSWYSFYITLISADLAQYAIFCNVLMFAILGKNGIKIYVYVFILR